MFCSVKPRAAIEFGRVDYRLALEIVALAAAAIPRCSCRVEPTEVLAPRSIRVPSSAWISSPCLRNGCGTAISIDRSSAGSGFDTGAGMRAVASAMPCVPKQDDEILT